MQKHVTIYTAVVTTVIHETRLLINGYKLLIVILLLLRGRRTFWQLKFLTWINRIIAEMVRIRLLLLLKQALEGRFREHYRIAGKILG